MAKIKNGLIERAGVRKYYRDDALHREDGPAVEKADGTQMWYIDGKLHRIGGPAVVEADGTRRWYVSGKKFREDGPAVERADGTLYWFKNNVKHRKGGPAIIRPEGAEEWWDNGYLHRVDGPAKTYADGTREWYHRQKLHRLDGPAVERQDGTVEYWLHGAIVTKDEFDRRIAAGEGDRHKVVRQRSMMEQAPEPMPVNKPSEPEPRENVEAPKPGMLPRVAGDLASKQEVVEALKLILGNMQTASGVLKAVAPDMEKVAKAMQDGGFSVRADKGLVASIGSGMDASMAEFAEAFAAFSAALEGAEFGRRPRIAIIDGEIFSDRPVEVVRVEDGVASEPTVVEGGKKFYDRALTKGCEKKIRVVGNPG